MRRTECFFILHSSFIIRHVRVNSTWRDFISSPHHAALATATLGLGFLSAEPLYFIAGVAAYVVGWVFVPDLPFFGRYLERRKEAARKAAESMELAQFNARRDKLLLGLTPGRRERYRALAKVCKDIEEAAAENADDPRLRKLEELMWTNLRLMTIEESLEEFLETEAKDDVQGLLANAEKEADALRAEIATLKGKGLSGELDARERLLTSRLERFETLRKRADRLGTAKANLALVIAEQERLDQQIKLIRADSIATRNAAALTARIDATVENLEHTNKWLSEMDQFRDILTDLPLTTGRAGFGETAGPPPMPQKAAQRKKEPN
jgi:hypothetical protein